MLLCIGALGNLNLRNKIYIKILKEIGFNFTSFNYITAIVSKYATIGEGTLHNARSYYKLRS